MRRLWQIGLFGTMLLSAQITLAQRASSGGFGHQGGASRGIGSPASGSPSSSGVATSATPGITFGRDGAAAIGNAGFPARLGATVGLQTIPPVALPPGVNGINHPGTAPAIQPFPGIQPLPTLVPGSSSINFPGGLPGPNNPLLLHHGGFRKDGLQDGKGHGFGPNRGRVPIVIYYGVPYYVPYVVYPQDSGMDATAGPPAESSSVAAGYLTEAPAAAPSEPPVANPSTAQPPTKPVTLLAFKDHTILAVTDYWIEGNWLYYEATPGWKTSIPLDQLDFALTQQLNRERNVPFVLESRP